MKKNKICAKRGKILYCEELNKFATATTDTKHTWVEVEEEEYVKVSNQR